MPKPFGNAGGGTQPLAGVERVQRPMTQARYAAAMGLLQSAMASAPASNSPALAFLTPIIGAMTGNALDRRRSETAGQEQRAAYTGLTGRDVTPEMERAMGVLSDPAAPDYLKEIARTMLKGDVPIDSPSQSRTAATPRPRLYGDVVTIDGVPGKYDGTGVWHPLIGPDGHPVQEQPPAGAAAPPAAPALPKAPAQPAMPRDPGGPVGPQASKEEDDLINKYLGL